MDWKGKYLSGLLFFLSTITGFSQNQLVADSLKALSVEELGNLEKIELFNKIAAFSTSPSEMIFYANKAFSLAEENKDSLKMATSYFFLAQANNLQGNLEEALNYSFRSLKICQSLNNSSGKAAVYNCISNIYQQQNNYNKSIEFLRLSIEINSETKRLYNLAGDYNNLGETFRLLNQNDSAVLYFQKALKIYAKENMKTGIAYTSGNIGLVEAKFGHYNKAETYIKEASLILVEHKDYYALAFYFISLAEIFKEKGEIGKAFYYAQESLKMARGQGLKEQIRDASLKLSQLYAYTKDYEKAYQYHAQYVSYRDSISNEEVIRKMADLRTEYEVSQKQAEIDLLSKQEQLNRIILLAVLFILALVAVLAFFLFRNNRIKRATNKILNQQKNELQQQQYKLEALINTKDRFFSIISHDLRGPVNAFNGISELIKIYIARNEMKELKEVSEYIDKSARQISTLLDNLLDWSVKQQGAFPFYPEKIHLNPVLEEIAEMFMVAAHGKKILLTVNLEDKIELWADRNSLMTIIRNLVNNALKFTEEHGLVTISAYQNKGYAMINVIDTGVGIPEEKLDHLFHLKERKIERGTAGEKGLGIGLSLAYEFAEMNHGTILVTSEENAGTIFTVKIPLFNEVKEEKILKSKLPLKVKNQ